MHHDPAEFEWSHRPIHGNRFQKYSTRKINYTKTRCAKTRRSSLEPIFNRKAFDQTLIIRVTQIIQSSFGGRA